MWNWLNRQWNDIKGNAKWAVIVLVGGVLYSLISPLVSAGGLGIVLRVAVGLVISGCIFGIGRLSMRGRLKQLENLGKLSQRGGQKALVEGRPNIYCFATTVIGVVLCENGGITEVPEIGRRYGESLNAVIAKFENEFSETAVNVETASARLIFRNGSGEVAVRIEDGCWLEEDFNFTYFDVGTVRSLVLCGISVPELEKPAQYRVAIPDDRRVSADRYNFLGYSLKPDEYDVDVVLNYGSRFRPTEYKFKLDIRDPAEPKVEILKAR